MSTRCHAPIAFETVVAYWADDLPPADRDRLEEHLMGCARCTAASARVAALAQAVSGLIPPVISADGLAHLRARGLRVVENPMRPGERKPVVFEPGVDILLHRLGGLELSRATRVVVTVSQEDTGEVNFRDDDAPFDREAGEVLIACQAHFRAFPPNIAIAVQSHDAAGQATEAVYTIPHVFL